MRISYLADHPEFIATLTQWLVAHWQPIFPAETPAARTAKLEAHKNREQLPIAWVAHAEGQPFGTAALRTHDLEGHERFTPWLGGLYVAPAFRRRGIGAALCAAVEEKARSLGAERLFLATFDKQEWYRGQGWTVQERTLWRGRSTDILYKRLSQLHVPDSGPDSNFSKSG